MVLRATIKLSSKLGIKSLQNYDNRVSAFDHWYGHLFSVNKVQYILLTNGYSLYSVVFKAKGVLDLQCFANTAAKNLSELMYAQRIEYLTSRFVNDSFCNIEVVKTNDRSILGSMNDMINHAEFFLNEYKMSLMEISERLNNTPYSLLDYKNPLLIIKNMPLTYECQNFYE